MIRLPAPCLVVLVGPSGAGKSTWADAQFRADQVVSSDRLRALVGEGEDDQRAGTDAFAVLDMVVERRLKRRLVTVVDTLGLEPKRRAGLVAAAAQAGVPAHAVVFTTPAAECRARNRARARPVPPKVLTAQLAQAGAITAESLVAEGFAAVHAPGEVRVVAPDLVAAPAARRRQQEDPMPLEFGLQLPRFNFPGGAAETAGTLRAVAEAAEEAGFTSMWVMDHFIQIPQAGRDWEDMLDSYTTLAFLAGVTRRVTLGALVTGVTYRNVAHLGKIVATLDVLSGGRAVCGIGAAWFEREHKAYGWEFPPLRERFELLEDALQALPLVWGKGAPSFVGRRVEIPEAICYPRPLQERVPIMIGGGGEKKTLRLVAQYADACNLFGDAATVAHKVSVLHRHCADVGRDPAEVRVTHLSSARVADADAVEDEIGRLRQLAEAGVQTAIVNLPDLTDSSEVERFAAVIAAF
ncbi:MAG TPA: TIGR03560 family F420-dependent LLM class oxidoreductase [Acidimicrobiales bacterium]|nr:TIGR03560 family F420-dependent LLM class oxidoreductase [Acidimicrobiales bacterium]